MNNPHPKGSRARVLLSSVFGPYAQDDEFGSRAINPMELYHNQVTKAQGSFSLRRFHRSWGILMIQENISAPCAVLDFPTREAFARELTGQRLRHRRHLLDHRERGQGARDVPHGAGAFARAPPSWWAATWRPFPASSDILDADHIVKGDGIAWMREYLGEDVTAPIRHPALSSGFGLRVMGVKIPDSADASATIIASMGCPHGLQLLHHFGVFRRQGEDS